MQIARRVYLYLVSIISLIMLLVGATSLLRLLLQLWLDTRLSNYVDNVNTYFRDEFSLYGAITLVGAIVWLTHWILAQRSLLAPKGELERQSVLRKLMVYMTLGVTALVVFTSAASVLEAFLAYFSDLDRPYFIERISDPVARVLVYSAGWLYYWKVRSDDNRVVPEAKHASTLRRWYFYVVNYIALTVLALNLASLADQTWQVITGRTISPGSSFIPMWATAALAWIVASLAIWLWHWTWVQHQITISEDEQHSPLRKVYLYMVLIQMIIVTLTSAALFLYTLLRYTLGDNLAEQSGESLLTATGVNVLPALIYGVFWWYHDLALKADTALLVEELPLQANLRRLYHYLITLISLSVLAIGLARLLRVLADFWLHGQATSNFTRQAWSDEISMFTTLILVGASVWFFYWRRLQQQTVVEGAEERFSLPRRIYLYLVLFGSVVALLFGTAWLFYQIFKLIGTVVTGSFISDISWALGITITGGTILAYHLRTLILDLKARPAVKIEAPGVAVPAEAGGGSLLLLVESSNPADLQSSLDSLKKILPPEVQMQTLPVGKLTLAEITARITGRASPDDPAGKQEHKGLVASG
ncbi:MAG TPA: DUF5671 domain-containing protein [Chloroflexia bacterium]|nr:DUF5671 domain-containing protein [Chloroflexia bacterium]